MSDIMLPRRSRDELWLDAELEKSTIFLGFVGLSVGIDRGKSLTRSTCAPLVSAEEILNGDAVFIGDGVADVVAVLWTLIGEAERPELTTRSPLKIFLIASA